LGSRSLPRRIHCRATVRHSILAPFRACDGGATLTDLRRREVGRQPRWARRAPPPLSIVSTCPVRPVISLCAVSLCISRCGLEASTTARTGMLASRGLLPQLLGAVLVLADTPLQPPDAAKAGTARCVRRCARRCTLTSNKGIGCSRRSETDGLPGQDTSLADATDAGARKASSQTLFRAQQHQAKISLRACHDRGMAPRHR
jgi:hypothetical protein